MDADGHDLLLPLVTTESPCLPLPVSVVARYWDVEIPESEALEAGKKYPAAAGSIMMEGLVLAEKHGLEARVFCADLPRLKRAIDMGVPPIVMLPGIGQTVQHASVISGYDPEESTIMHYIPKMEKDGSFHIGAIPEKRFDQNWAEDGRMMIAIAPKEISDRIPRDSGEEAARLCLESERKSLAGDQAGAAEDLRRAVSLSPDSSAAHSLLGSALNASGSPDCLAHYEKSVKLNPRSYLAHRGLGNYYLKAKRHDMAESHYTEAISINAERFGPIYKNRAVARMEMGDEKGGRSDLEKYLKHTPDAADRASIEQALKS